MEFELEDIPEHLAKYFEPKHKQWLVRNDIIWAKRNAMPSSATDRFTKKHEYIFFMVKQKKYYFDLDGIRDQDKQASRECALRGMNENKYSMNMDVRQGVHKPRPNRTKIGKDDCEMFGSPRARVYRDNYRTQTSVQKYDDLHGGLKGHSGNSASNPKGKNPGDVSDFWDIPTKPTSSKHYASYNSDLISKPIIAGCPKDGVILDPFCGTGTTIIRAIELGRIGIGFDGNKDYVELANKTIEPLLTQSQLFG